MAETIYAILLGALLCALILSCLAQIVMLIWWRIDDWLDRSEEMRCARLKGRLQEIRNRNQGPHS